LRAALQLRRGHRRRQVRRQRMRGRRAGSGRGSGGHHGSGTGTFREPEFALPDCTYGTGRAELKYAYDGINDCRAAVVLSGGSKECDIGCLGLGTCAEACPFGAITMGEDNLPHVDKEKCTGCGTCERACPKNIIRLTSATQRMLEL
jgi:formate dehydrogenase beta subunit